MNAGFVGTLSADLHLPEATSLKDKRKPLHGVRAALVRATGCSVAEVDDHDVLRRTRLTLSVVARDADGALRLLDTAERILSEGPFEVLALSRHVLSADEFLLLPAGR